MTGPPVIKIRIYKPTLVTKMKRWMSIKVFIPDKVNIVVFVSNIPLLFFKNVTEYSQVTTHDTTLRNRNFPHLKSKMHSRNKQTDFAR